MVRMNQCDWYTSYIMVFLGMFMAKLYQRGLLFLLWVFASIKRFTLVIYCTFIYRVSFSWVGIFLIMVYQYSFYTTQVFMFSRIFYKNTDWKSSKKSTVTVLIFIFSVTVFIAGSVLKLKVKNGIAKVGPYGNIIWFCKLFFRLFCLYLVFHLLLAVIGKE